MFKPPAFFESKGVLLLGMGGGYDVFAGIPLFFELRERGVPAVLANLSFAFHLDQKMNPQQETVGSDRTICIRAHHGDHPGGAFAGEQFPANYYPEFQLSQWLQREHKLDVPVYTFNLRGERGPKLGVKNYAAAVAAIVAKHDLDSIVLVDAGVDSVLRGDEEGVGTYSEDLLTILAVRQMAHLKRYLMCVGLGTESRISEFDFLKNWNGIARLGGYLGCVGWNAETHSVQQYVRAVNACHPTNTTINTAIAATLEGHHGSYCPPPLYARGLRDADMKLQPLTTLCWFFGLEAVLGYRLFLDECEGAVSMDDLCSRFEEARVKAKIVDGKSAKYLGTRPYKMMFGFDMT